MTELRDYQRLALDAILTTKNGIISAATGSGKTTMMSAAIEQQDGNALVLVHTRALVYQTAERIKAETSKSVSMFFGEAHQSLKSDVVVATWQTLANATYIKRDYFKHIHVDECHNARGDKYSSTIKSFKPKTLHGYTATFHGSGEEKLKDIFGDIVFEIGLFELIELGYLSKMKIMVNVGPVGGKKYNESKFSIIREATKKNGVVEKALHFYSRNKRFDEISKWNLLEDGSYASISAGTKAADRERLFNDFRDENSGLNHLISNRVLNEGIDLPITNTLIFHENIGDFRTITQRFGRGLRVWEDNHDITTQIMMFIDEEKRNQIHSLDLLLGEIEYEASKRGVKAVSNRKSSSYTKHDDDPTDDCPVKIVMMDKTQEIMNTFRGSKTEIKDFTLDEFVEQMRKDGIINSNQYRKIWRDYNFGSNPQRKFNMTDTELWKKVRGEEDFTLDEFVEQMRKDGIANGCQYFKVWRNYNFGSVPHRKLNMTNTELWKRVRGEV